MSEEQQNPSVAVPGEGGEVQVTFPDRPSVRNIVLVAALTILGVVAAVMLAIRLRGFLYLLFMALFFSVALEPAVQWLAKRGWKRGRASVLVFFGSILAFMGFIAAIVPLIVNQATSLVESFPDLIDSVVGTLNDWFGIEVDTEELNQDLSSAGRLFRQFGEQLGGGVLAIGQTVFGAVINWVTIGLFTFYMLADGPRLRSTVLSVFRPQRQREAMNMWEIAVEKTGGYVYSRALLAAVSAIFHSVAFTFLDLPFPVPLGIWIGVLSEVIPVVGTYLGAVLPLIVALANDPLTALWVLVVIIIYQQFENFVLSPRITSRTMEIHPAVSVGAIMIGGTLMGVSGVIAALPVAAIIQAFISTTVERHAVVDGTAEDEPAEEDPP